MELPAPPPPPATPAPERVARWREVFAIIGIAAGFAVLLTIPGWYGIRAWRRYKRGEGELTGWTVWGIFATAFIVLSIILGAFLGSPDTESAAEPTTGTDSGISPGLTVPSVSPSPSPKESKNPAVVKNMFNKLLGWSTGEELSFGVFWLRFPDDDCDVHTYRLRGRPRGAFLSGCASWEPEYDILLFRLGFKNTSKHPVTLILRNLVLTDRSGNTYAPVNVRSHAKFPPYFLNERQKLPPKGKWSGWVTFDGRVVSLVPASLSYIDSEQTLVQVFAGKPNVVQASG